MLGCVPTEEQKVKSVCESECVDNMGILYRKYGIGSDCISAPNAEVLTNFVLLMITKSLQYIVTGRGYTFTRHNNKVTMNINSDVFFDDNPVPSDQAFPCRTILRRQAPLPPIKNPKEQI